MRLLLDTHIWLWSLLEPARLEQPMAEALESPDSELWLSPVSVWETLMLAKKGRVVLEPAAQAWVTRALQTVPLHDAPLNREVALASRRVELGHEDPADRFLAATAAVYDLQLVTADRRLRAGRGFPIFVP